MQVLSNIANQGTPVAGLLMFDYLRAFHKYKPINKFLLKDNQLTTYTCM